MTSDVPVTRLPRVPDEAVDYYVGIRRESVLTAEAIAQMVIRLFDLPHTPKQLINVCRSRGAPTNGRVAYADYTPQMISDYETLVSCRVKCYVAADIVRVKYKLPVTTATVYNYMNEHADPTKMETANNYVLVVVEQTKMVAKRLETL